MTRTFLRDLAERTLATYAEALVSFLILAPVLDADRVLLALVAALPAGFSAAKALLLEWLGKTPAPRSFGVALLERIVATWAVTFLGLVAANPGDVATYRLAAVSALTAALAVVKGVLAALVGSPDTPSLDPKRITP